eukprot:1137681-Pelagomonas_calceolata.AAC.2
MHNSNSETSSQVLKAGLHLAGRGDSCWSAHLSKAFSGMRNEDMFKQKMQNASKNPMRDFIGNVRYRQQKVWREADAVSPQGVIRKAMTNHHFEGVMKNARRFRLRAQGLKVKSYKWLGGSNVCDKYESVEVQDEIHAFFLQLHCNCFEKDGGETARVHPNTGVKQGCPLSPLLFSLHVNDIPVDDLAEGVQGAVTGTDRVHVTRMLYADDLTSTANVPEHNANNAESPGCLCTDEAPNHQHSKVRSGTLQLLGIQLACVLGWWSASAHKESFKYLGMLSCKHISVAKTSERFTGSFMASAYRIPQFVREHAVRDRLHMTLWL